MSSSNSNRQAPIFRIFDNLLLSGFVIVSFIVYAIHEHLIRPDTNPADSKSTVNTQASFPTQSANPNSTISNFLPTQVVMPPPLAKSSTHKIHYADGVYNGPTGDVYYGLVSVQATVQNGSSVDVQFLQYPNDRRTSIRINSFAMPYLQHEAIKAQTANVNLISGVTLTAKALLCRWMQPLSQLQIDHEINEDLDGHAHYHRGH